MVMMGMDGGWLHKLRRLLLKIGRQLFGDYYSSFSMHSSGIWLQSLFLYHSLLVLSLETLEVSSLIHVGFRHINLLHRKHCTTTIHTSFLPIRPHLFELLLYRQAFLMLNIWLLLLLLFKHHLRLIMGFIRCRVFTL